MFCSPYMRSLAFGVWNGCDVRTVFLIAIHSLPLVDGQARCCESERPICAMPGRCTFPIQALRGTSEFDEWFLLQPPGRRWSGPALRERATDFRRWAAYRNTTWMHSFKDQPAKGWSPALRLVRPRCPIRMYPRTALSAGAACSGNCISS